MSNVRGRRVIVAGAVILSTAIGAGLVQAAPSSTPTSSPATSPATTATSPATPAQADEADGRRPAIPGRRLRNAVDRLRDGGPGRWREHVVHGTITVQNRDGELVTIQFDGGTVAAVDDGSITIAEAGGTQVTVATDAETRVRKGRARASLEALEVGDRILVRSIVEDGAATARVIVVRPATPEPGTTEPAAAQG